MATVRTRRLDLRNDYPTSDGKPMAETDWHRDLMLELIETLRWYFRARRRVYVSGNSLIFYERGNRRRHVAPDVFVVKGVPKHNRPNYLLWEEGRAPQVAIELTSSSTRREDLEVKFTLYRDVLKIREYYLFDPRRDYLDPPLIGFRLRQGQYREIALDENGRMPSQVLGLQLQRVHRQLRLFDPATGELVPTPTERAEQGDRVAAEVKRLRAELDALRHTRNNGR